jgi:hypothetical protein
VPEMLEADIGEDAFRSLIPESTTNDHYTVRMLTPLLTPLSAICRNVKQSTLPARARDSTA